MSVCVAQCISIHCTTHQFLIWTYLLTHPLQLSWQPPLLSLQNGIITGYDLYYQRDPSSDSIFNFSDPLHVVNISSSGTAPNYTVSGLSPFILYDFHVSAHTQSPGEGPQSSLLQVTTLASPPAGPPLNVQIISRSISSLTISWQAPLPILLNGPITMYSVRVMSAASGTQPIIFNVTITSNNIYVFTASGLVAGTQYSVAIQVYILCMLELSDESMILLSSFPPLPRLKKSEQTRMHISAKMNHYLDDFVI